MIIKRPQIASNATLTPIPINLIDINLIIIFAGS